MCMNAPRRRAVRIFFRTFSISLVLLLSPVLLLLGCTVAEINTRALGFGDSSPAVAAYRDEEGLHLTFFGSEYLTPGRVIRKAEVTAAYLWTALPREFRAAAGIITALPELLRQAIAWVGG